MVTPSNVALVAAGATALWTAIRVIDWFLKLYLRPVMERRAPADHPSVDDAPVLGTSRHHIIIHRLDDHERQIDRTNQRVDQLRQDMAQIKTDLQWIRGFMESKGVPK